MRLIDTSALDELITHLREDGYRVMGPVLRDAVITIDEIESTLDLPAGWADEQDGGSYRVTRRDDGRLFGFATTAHPWKSLVHPPRDQLLAASSTPEDGLTTTGLKVWEPEVGAGPLALLGMRSCDTHALAVLDRVLDAGPYRDNRYGARRAGNIVIAVDCHDPAATCFCSSLGTGPAVTTGFDLALTELSGSDRSGSDRSGRGPHRFLARAGTPAGELLLAAIPSSEPTAADHDEASAMAVATLGRFERRLDPVGLHDTLAGAPLHPQWELTADRCLACGNCTMVCPTCFCTSVSDTSDLTGVNTERWRSWDSCFSLSFSLVHSGPVRSTVTSRYRHWLTHKLATWVDQFGTLGCVGCGRCITWCPPGIDLTDHVADMLVHDIHEAATPVALPTAEGSQR